MELADLLQRELKDPRVGFVTVTEARVTTDDKERDSVARHASRSRRHKAMRDMVDHAAGLFGRPIDAS